MSAPKWDGLILAQNGALEYCPLTNCHWYILEKKLKIHRGGN